MSSDVVDDRSEVHCFKHSLSVHDFDSVGGASGRDGFRRTCPREEKYERPFSRDWLAPFSSTTAATGWVQGVESS